MERNSGFRILWLIREVEGKKQRIPDPVADPGSGDFHEALRKQEASAGREYLFYAETDPGISRIARGEEGLRF